ncbi:L-serine ammonia-lyase, iron-sulfur-dependent subunit beta [Anaerobranca gottschalkii]|uniref:L-serine deaminase n=1 Tax=Anaerobranca gottschalkii DSM 13577 TaxID=1120990 RepID=A0A1H9YY49_9FIRM|nr:L-serine ammonia-lyase, iron-sulfur-dependent subunit beta [Anaerobranca gottschalkii]SES74188.1 L-serine dehydratase [Anaerobranca gottschalkii DSM 13577]
MSVFDIIGPVMIGPSSSHTAGAVRLGKMARTIANEPISHCDIFLYGSFAKTYKGHGTDLALIAGLLGFDTDDEKIKDSFILARKQQLTYRFIESNKKGYHPNTVEFHIETKSGQRYRIVGSSIGGGNIIITELDNFKVKLTGTYFTLIIPHEDRYGIISKITSEIAKDQVNIAYMRVIREQKGVRALMVIETDQQVSQSCLDNMLKLDGVLKVSFINPI